MPGVTTHAVASSTVASGYAARSSAVEPTATITLVIDDDRPADEHVAPLVHGDDVAAADHPLHEVMLSDRGDIAARPETLGVRHQAFQVTHPSG